MRGSLCGCLWIVAALAGWPAGAISVGQVDTFQADTLQGWGGGSAPTNVATDGPGGAGDRYLQIRAAGGNLGTDNAEQWAGDYLSAGITSLRFELQNQGANPVALRITVFGPNLATAFTAVDEFVLAPGSGWVSAEFALTQSALERKMAPRTTPSPRRSRASRGCCSATTRILSARPESRIPSPRCSASTTSPRCRSRGPPRS
jgi:hypothetical protein